METSKVRSTGGGFKKRNEVGVISSVKRVVEVKTVSHKDVRAAQIGCQLPEKEQVWSRMDEGVESDDWSRQTEGNKSE